MTRLFWTVTICPKWSKLISTPVNRTLVPLRLTILSISGSICLSLTISNMSSSDLNSIYRFSQHLNDKVSPDLVLGDIARIVTLMKIALREDSVHDPLVFYLDCFITEYLDSFKCTQVNR